MLKKVAIVVPRAGQYITGGAESYAMTMAKSLSKKYKVYILTTTAKDSLTWKNEYKKENEVINKRLILKRFSVDNKRTSEFWKLNSSLQKNTSLEKYHGLSQNLKSELISSIQKTPTAVCENWIRLQGPYSTDLFDYLEKNQSNYDIFLFITYLYATTYFGMEKIRDQKKVFLIPTYHNEPVAYLPVFQKYNRLFHLFLTRSEQEFAEEQVYKTRINSSVIGFGLSFDYDPEQPYGNNHSLPGSRREYFLYAGRLEKGKGVLELFCMFEKYSQIHKNVYLYCIGQGELKNFTSTNIIYQGFVSEEQKFKLIKGATAFLHPSAYESLGIALLESFMVGTPAIVNAHSNVLREHIKNSCAGFYYWNEKEFFEYMDKLIFNPSLQKNLSHNAIRYFLNFYSLVEYEKRLFENISSKA